MEGMEKHIIAMLLENESGALSRVVGLFSQRGYNIESLTVSTTEDASLSRLTLTTYATSDKVEQILKHINRLIDVFKVKNLTELEHVERELMLVKLHAQGLEQRAEVKRCADIFRGQIIDISEQTYVVQLVGTGDKLDAFLQLFSRDLIIEVVRSGTSGIARGMQSLG